MTVSTPPPENSWHLDYAQLPGTTGTATAPAGLDGIFEQTHPKLLLVDDQALNIEVLHQIFQADHEVFMATSGTRAIEVCRTHRPDLILLDVMMPDMSGFEVCRALKSDPLTQDIPIIFVTAQDTAFDEARGFEEGGVDFISKPVNPAVVRARVKAHLTIKAQADLLRGMALIDGLTGVANRRHFNDQLDEQWNAARRSGSDLAVIMIDVDYFKNFNDSCGHEQGDACLRAIATALAGTLNRGQDLLARYGGEEFVALLPNTSLAGAKLKAEALRQAVLDLKWQHPSSEIAGGVVTVSLGVSAVQPGPAFTSKDLMIAADRQLYRAKRNGRNQFACKAVSLA